MAKSSFSALLKSTWEALVWMLACLVLIAATISKAPFDSASAAFVAFIFVPTGLIYAFVEYRYSLSKADAKGQHTQRSRREEAIWIAVTIASVTAWAYFFKRNEQDVLAVALLNFAFLRIGYFVLSAIPLADGRSRRWRFSIGRLGVVRLWRRNALTLFGIKSIIPRFGTVPDSWIEEIRCSNEGQGSSRQP